MSKCFNMYLNPILFVLPLLYFSPGRTFFFSKFFPFFTFVFLYFGHRELRVFENGVSQNPPGHTGSKLSSLC